MTHRIWPKDIDAKPPAELVDSLAHMLHGMICGECNDPFTMCEPGQEHFTGMAGHILFCIAMYPSHEFGWVKCGTCNDSFVSVHPHDTKWPAQCATCDDMNVMPVRGGR